MEEVSTALRNYLEAIVLLGGTPEHSVRSIDIARKLDVSKPSVNSAISSLKKKGLVSQPFHGEVTITEEGYRLGACVAKNHELSRTFLLDVLQVPADDAEKEANLIKHAIGERSAQKWSAFLNSYSA